MSGDDARAKIAAGADLVQIYTGLIYRGPALVPEAGARDRVDGGGRAGATLGACRRAGGRLTSAGSRRPCPG